MYDIKKAQRDRLAKQRKAVDETITEKLYAAPKVISLDNLEEKKSCKFWLLHVWFNLVY